MFNIAARYSKLLYVECHHKDSPRLFSRKDDGSAMFGIGFSEILLIAVVALIFIGPKKLPEFMRQAGRFFVQMRRTANEVRSTFDQVIQDAENEIRKEEAEAMQALLETKKELQGVAAEVRTLQAEAKEVVSFGQDGHSGNDKTRGGDGSSGDKTKPVGHIGEQRGSEGISQNTHGEDVGSRRAGDAAAGTASGGTTAGSSTGSDVNGSLPVSSPSDNLSAQKRGQASHDASADDTRPSGSESYSPGQTQVKGRYEVLLPPEEEQAGEHHQSDKPRVNEHNRSEEEDSRPGGGQQKND